MDFLIPLIVAIPLVGAFLTAIIGSFAKGFGKIFTSIILAILVGLSIYFLMNIREPLIYKVGGWELLDKIPIAIYMVVDGLTIYLLLIINIVGFLSAFYSIGYIKKFTAENNYYTLFCLMVAGMNGVVVSGDLFNIYVFLEMAAIASYALVAFGIEKEELEASFKYQVLGGVSSLFILLSIGFLYWYTATLNIADVSNVIGLKGKGELVVLAQVILLAGFGLKAAMIPFHAWLPDAHSSAPSPISSMLSGVLIKAIGAYIILRLFFNMFTITRDFSLVITVLGTLSMIIGGLLAIGQWDIKRLLAYSSISQMGYVFLGVGIGMLVLSQNGERSIAALAIAGGLFHLLNHAIFKGLLFLNAGAVEHETGIRDMNKLGGLSAKMPVTTSTSFSASMSISGIPPFNGFFSKLIIVIAAIQAKYFVLSILAVFISIITLAMYLKVLRFTFFNKAKEDWNDRGISVREVPFSMCFSMIVLAILCFALSLLMVPSLRDLILTPAVDVLMNAGAYSAAVLGY
jgi:multicomponent Na+:H+ antiporter subunit D